MEKIDDIILIVYVTISNNRRYRDIFQWGDIEEIEQYYNISPWGDIEEIGQYRRYRNICF